MDGKRNSSASLPMHKKATTLTPGSLCIKRLQHNFTVSHSITPGHHRLQKTVLQPASRPLQPKTFNIIKVLPVSLAHWQIMTFPFRFVKQYQRSTPDPVSLSCQLDPFFYTKSVPDKQAIQELDTKTHLFPLVDRLMGWKIDPKLPKAFVSSFGNQARALTSKAHQDSRDIPHRIQMH